MLPLIAPIGPSKRKQFAHRGEASPRAKLTNAQVVNIKAAVALGYTQAACAEHFGVSVATVSMIVAGKRWAHITAEYPTRPVELTPEVKHG